MFCIFSLGCHFSQVLFVRMDCVFSHYCGLYYIFIFYFSYCISALISGLGFINAKVQINFGVIVLYAMVQINLICSLAPEVPKGHAD